MNVNSGSFLSLSFAIGLLCLAAYGPADAETRPSGALHLAADADDEEDDVEEEAVDYRDRVREIKQWMGRRDSERKGEAPTLDLPAAPPAPASRPYPKYFQDNGYDANGYRTRLRDAPQASYTRHYYPRRHYHRAWHRRWHRHVHSYVRYYRHHGRHGHRHYYHRHYYHPLHRHAGHSWRRHGRHSWHHAAHPAWHSSHHHAGRHAAPSRHLAKRAHAGYSAAGKKKRSRR